MRTISGHVFAVKTWARSCVGFVVGGQLPEAGLTQAAVTSEESAILPEDRPGGQGRKLIASVRFVERLVWNVEPPESLDALVQVTFVGNAADNEMRMR